MKFTVGYNSVKKFLCVDKIAGPKIQAKLYGIVSNFK